MRCDICHAELERYALLGHPVDSIRYHGYACPQGHFKREVRDRMVWTYVLRSWTNISRLDGIDSWLYQVLILAARLLWYTQCGYRHALKRRMPS